MNLNRNYADAELLAALKTEPGMDEAIRTMYKHYYTMVQQYVMNNSGSPEDAEDIFQEITVTFIDMVQQNKFRQESSVSTFLYSLARHSWLNELKKRGRTRIRERNYEKGRNPFEESSAGRASAIATNRESMKLLMKAVDELGETCKKILLAFYFENKAMREILETLDYENEQVVRNKKYKCLKQLEQSVMAQPMLAQNLKSILAYE